MDVSSAEYALLQPLYNAQNTDGGIQVGDVTVPVVFENEDYSHETDDSYVRCEKIEGEITSLTTTGSFTREDGAIMVEMNTELGIDKPFANALETAIRSLLPVSTEFVRGTWRVLITSLAIGNQETVGKFRRQELSVNYLAYSARGG